MGKGPQCEARAHRDTCEGKWPWDLPVKLGTGQEDRSPELDPRPPSPVSRWVHSSTPRTAHRLYCVAKLAWQS